MSKNPDDTIYDDEDKENYTRLILKTNALYRGNNPEKAVRVMNGIIYLVTFGKIGKSIGERELLLFRAILMRC